MQIIGKRTSRLWLGLVLAAGFATAAEANGTGRGAASVAVPVPAPAPVPDFAADYYIRLDISYNWSDTQRFETEYDVYAPTLREDAGLEEFARYGLGLGLYLSRGVRADITIDVRNEITGDADDDSVVYIDPVTGLEMEDSIFDEIRARTWTGLVNGYIDLPWGHPTFTPYVGAGVGLVLHSISRTLNQTITCTDALCPGDPPVTFAGTDKDYAFAFAGALMVGATYDITPSTKFDFGYRLLYLDGADFSLNVGAGNPNQHVIIDDQIVHELRVGLRFDIE